MPASDHLPVRLIGRSRQLVSRLRASLWIGPAASALAAVVLALTLPSVDASPAFLDGLDGEASRAAITTVVGATVAAISLVVTGLVVALQLATGQFSPRLLRDTLEDRNLQAVLAVFTGAVTYGLVLAPQIGSEDPPRVAVLVGVVGGIAVVSVLVWALDVIVRRLRLEEIIARVVARTLAAIEASAPGDADDGETVEVPEHAVALRARRSGYLQEVALDALLDTAADVGVCLRLSRRTGAFVVDGAVVAHAWRPRAEAADVDEDDRDRLETAIDGALALGVDRTLTDDPGYGIRHLTDIALRALSPGINDPTTAVQCIDSTTGLLAVLARTPIADDVRRGDTVEVSHPRPTFADHLELAQTQPLHHGIDDPHVVTALANQLRDVAACVTDDQRMAEVVTAAAVLEARVEAATHTRDERTIIARALQDLTESLPA